MMFDNKKVEAPMTNNVLLSEATREQVMEQLQELFPTMLFAGVIPAEGNTEDVFFAHCGGFSGRKGLLEMLNDRSDVENEKWITYYDETVGSGIVSEDEEDDDN
jgi:hypothetical protein